MQVHLKTLGCRLNEAELETWGQAFQHQGHTITQSPEHADLIIINSCAVTQDAARKSRQLIRKIHRLNPLAKLVVSGCYATLNQNEAEQLLGVDLVISNNDKDQLVAKTLSALNLQSMPAMSTEPGALSLFNRGRQRAFVKVQDGCRYRCTFCIVTVARGEERSRPVEEIIREINALHDKGVQEVIITGVHLGGYGSDTGGKLSDLIQAILSKTDIPRLRLGSLEPWELDQEFFELFENPRLQAHLHLPLQSGSDSVLRRMARRCKTEEFYEIVRKLRLRIPHFNVTTDIIVGFPGETDPEWQESLAFIESVGFGEMHIFTYSRRDGTKAAELDGQIPDSVKKMRSHELHQLAAQMKQNFYRSNLGNEFTVLWEGHTEIRDDGKHLVFGYTGNYLRAGCIVDAPEQLENQIDTVKLISAQDRFILTESILGLSA